MAFASPAITSFRPTQLPLASEAASKEDLCRFVPIKHKNVVDFLSSHGLATLRGADRLFSAGAASSTCVMQINLDPPSHISEMDPLTEQLKSTVRSYFPDGRPTASLVIKSYLREECSPIFTSGDYKIFMLGEHPNIVKIFGLVLKKEDGSYYTLLDPTDTSIKETDIVCGIIMEKADADLQDFYRIKLRERSVDSAPSGIFTPADIRKFIVDIATPLEFLLEKDIRYGDLKPENILVFSSGDATTYKLADFDSIFVAERTSSIDFSRGTPGYEAPEVFLEVLGRQHVASSDVWSLTQIVAMLALNCRTISPIHLDTPLQSKGYKKFSPTKSPRSKKSLTRSTPLHFFEGKKYSLISADLLNLFKDASSVEQLALLKFLDAGFASHLERMSISEVLTHELLTEEYKTPDEESAIEILQRMLDEYTSEA